MLAYLDALTPESRARLQALLKDKIIPLSATDAALYAANSFTLEKDVASSLFMPAGVSERLLAQVRECGVDPVVVEVSEFLRKGGGAVKCMIGDLGPNDETGLSEEQRRFRSEWDYLTLFSDSKERL